MRRIVAVLFVLSGFICLWSSARADDLASIRAAIAEKGAAWVAGETSISILPPAERQKRLGALEPVLTGDEQVLAPLDEAQAARLAASFDWRNNGGNFVTSVKDQGSCGSCWAFSTTAALESAILIGRSTPGVDLNLSEQTLVSCDYSNGCNGWYINYAADYVVSNGLPAEACYPYTMSNGRCSAACANWQTCCPYKAAGWSWVASGSASVTAIKNALASHGPVVAQFKVYHDFDYYQGGVYSYSWGYYRGDHAVLVTGYNDNTQSFNVKNSWGPYWGEGGYFRIAYSQVTSGLIRFGYYSVVLTPQRQYQLKVNKAGNGAGTVSSFCLTCSGATCSRYYPSGTHVTIGATPTGHQVFGGWSGCTSTSGTTCNVSMAGAATVTATFLQPPAVSVSPSPVVFGGVTSGTSKSLSVKVANGGTADLLLSSTTITGTGGALFSVTASTCSGAIKKGSPCALTVAFSPTGKGAKTATLVITSNEPASPRKIVLNGTGK